MIEIWLLALAAPAAEAAPLPAFMTGCWEQVDAARWTQECWMEPRGGIMLGASRSGNGDTLREWEQLRIAPGADGKLSLYASPGGAQPTVFALGAAKASEIEFVNPAHDYPQRIRYWREGEQLRAEISLIDGSKPRGWTYRREGAAD